MGAWDGDYWARQISDTKLPRRYMWVAPLRFREGFALSGRESKTDLVATDLQVAGEPAASSMSETPATHHSESEVEAPFNGRLGAPDRI